MNRWQDLKQAEQRAKAEEERLCALYDCYPWEINIERQKAKHRRKEVLPFIYHHMENGVEVDQGKLKDLFQKYNVVDDSDEGEKSFDLETLSPDLLEDILMLFIEANDALNQKSNGPAY